MYIGEKADNEIKFQCEKEGVIQAHSTQPRCCSTTRVMGTSNMTEFRRYKAHKHFSGGEILKYESK